MAIDMRALVAGLAGGANTLGTNINRRKDRREVEAEQEKMAQRAEDRAMRMLLAKPSKENTQVVTGADENGPGIFLVDKDTGTKKRITDQAMAQLTGAPAAPPRPSLLRKPGDAMPDTSGYPIAPPLPGEDDTETHHPSTEINPAPRLGGTLRPLPPKVTTPPVQRRTPTPVMQDGKSVLAMADPSGKFYDQAGNPLTGVITPYVAPKEAPLVTAVGPGGKQIRAVDKPGVEVPGPGNSGAAKFKTAIAENRARMKDIDAALEEYNKHPEATGGLLRDIADVVPVTATAITKYDQNKHPELVPAQAAIANIGSLVIHDRSGTAVTISEFPRLAPFIPAKGDKPEVVRAKLKSLSQQIERLVAEMETAGGTGTPDDSDDAEFDAMMATAKPKPKPPAPSRP